MNEYAEYPENAVLAGNEDDSSDDYSSFTSNDSSYE